MVDRDPAGSIYTYTFLLVHLLALAFLFPRWRCVQAVLQRNVWIVALAVLALLSCLWSLEPIISLRRVFALTGSFALVLALTIQAPPRAYLRLLVRVAVVFIVSTPVIVVLLPEYGKGVGVYADAWRGVTPHKNNLGWMLAISVVLLIYAYRLRVSSRRLVFWATPGAVFCLWMTQSATSYLALLVALIAMSLIGVVKRVRGLRPLLFGSLVCFAAGVALMADQWTQQVLRILGKSPTLTGRTVIWDRLFSAISERPFLGHGYRAFWESDYAVDLMTISGFFAGHSHNGYLDMLLDLGAVGLTILLFACLKASARLAQAAVNGDLIAEAHLVLLLTCLFIGFSGQVVLRPNTFYFILMSMALIHASGLNVRTPTGRPNLKHQPRRPHSDQGPQASNL